MFKNYLTVAWRNLKRNKVFTFINIIGLAIGISASLVIYLLVYYDFSFDKHHKGVDRMYRVVSSLHFPGTLINNGGVSFPLPEAFKKEVTGVEASAAFQLYYSPKVSIPSSAGNADPTVFRNQKGDMVFANGDYFNLFEHEWISGSPQTSLSEPFQVVLTEAKATKYFPGVELTDVVGRTIYYNDSVKVKVTGIVKQPRATTDFDFTEFISHSTITNSNIKNNMSWDQWGSVNSDCQFYVKLNQGIGPKNIEKQLVALRSKYAKDDYMKTENLLQPINRLHFTADYDFFSERRAHKPTLYGLLSVAGFLLILACINFINLTTAQSASRAKEIGIRKTMGGSKRNLILQFLGETFLLTSLATIVSVLIAPLILKIFSDFMPPELRFNLLDHPQVILFSVIIILAVTVFAGFYPAIVLSRFQPVAVLKNQLHANTTRTRKATLRKVLTVSQFVIAQFFVIATIAIGKQIKFALNKDMGFRKDAIVTMHVPWSVSDKSKKTTLLNKLRSYPEIASVTMAGATPASSGYSSTTMKFTDGKKEIESTVEIKYADSSYFKLYQIPLVAGRYASSSDSVATEYVINESYAKFLGFSNPQEVLGKIIERGKENRVTIVGVIRDFNMKSIHSNITPLVFANMPGNFSTYHILMSPNDPEKNTWKSAIAKMEAAWKEVYPEQDFGYNFLDESIASFYKKEQNTSKLLGWATGLAILISCLGLLGLVMYTTTQRTKEIGVRKVLGASVGQLIKLLSKDLLVLVLLAIVIAAPLAWLALHSWLQDFAYRTSLSLWVFLMGGALMILVAIITLSIQTIRAALRNPVGALRSE